MQNDVTVGNHSNLVQLFLLSPDVEGILAGEEGGPGGGADLLAVGLLQHEAVLCQPLHPGGGHVGVVPGNIVPAKVISQDENDIWLFSLADN